MRPPCFFQWMFFPLFSDGHLILCASDVAGGEGFGSATPAVFGRQKCPRWTWEMGNSSCHAWNFVVEKMAFKKYMEKPCRMKYQKPDTLRYLEIPNYIVYVTCACKQLSKGPGRRTSWDLSVVRQHFVPLNMKLFVFFSRARQSQSDTLFSIEMLHKAILSHKATLGFPLVEFQLADM